MLILNGRDKKTDHSLAKAYLSLSAEGGNLLASEAMIQLGGIPKAQAKKIVDERTR